jgi:alpha/beta superfamily hydrolase
MRGENHRWTRLFRGRGINVEAILFHRHSPRLVANAAKFTVEIVSNRGFIARNGFDIDQLPRKCNSVHGKRITYCVQGHSDLKRSCNLNTVIAPSSTIRSLFLEGPAGRLEALLNSGSENATRAAIVCHPHPLFGGTLHNKVVFHTMKALNALGFPVLRFNFRGAGLSQGEHDHGNGEVEDVRTALDWLDAEFHLPLLFAGFSFGAVVGLRAACPDDRVKALIGVGVPAVPVAEDAEAPRVYTFDFLQNCLKPKLFVSGARDQFGPRAKLETLVASIPEPKKLVLIEGGDHFFEGRLRELRETIEGWVRQEFVREPSL